MVIFSFIENRRDQREHPCIFFSDSVNVYVSSLKHQQAPIYTCVIWWIIQHSLF